MIVVMPLGYGDLDYVRTAEVRRDPAKTAEHYKRFSRLCSPKSSRRSRPPTTSPATATTAPSPVFPWAGWRVSPSASLIPTKFAYVIGLSSAAQSLPANPEVANINPKTANLRLLWVLLRHRGLAQRAQPQARRLAQIERNASQIRADSRRPLLDRHGRIISSTSPRCSSRRSKAYFAGSAISFRNSGLSVAFSFAVGISVG